MDVKEQVINFNVGAIEKFLGIPFEGTTMEEKEAFVAEHHTKRLEVTNDLMKDSYDDFVKE